MKTKSILLLLALAAANPAAATDSAKPPCVSCCEELKPAVPLTSKSLYQLDAKWTDDAGETKALAALRGQPVIIAMFFAQCEYACPMLVSDLQRVQAGLSADVRAKARVVLVSFDIARDTPAALKAYRERMQLDGTWQLLRGDTNAVQDLAMLLGVKFKQDGRGQFAHSNLITVLNAEGEITRQRAGLQGDVSELTQAVQLAAKLGGSSPTN
jgi:protein SCO1